MRPKAGNAVQVWDSGSTLSLGDEDNWRCCFCCHVRTGTVFLGAMHMALHFLSLMAILVAILQPQLSELPVQNNQGISIADLAFGSNVLDTAGRPNGNSSLNSSTLLEHWLANNCTLINRNNLNVTFVLILSTSIITLLLLYGTIKGKASYLIPFFCMEVFRNCVTSLSAIGYLLIIPDIRSTAVQNPDFPMRDELINANPAFLSFSLLAGIFIFLTVNSYCVWIIWKCYKYLLILDMVLTESDCEEGLEGELPSYAEAVADQTKINLSSPPPYSQVVIPIAAETETKCAA